jgi:hypothetical protein
MNTRTHQQELNFLREMNYVIRTQVEAFAYSAAVTVNRGRVYRFAEEIGLSPLEITTSFGRDLRHLKRVGDLADVYVRPDTVEFARATWLAISCFGMSTGTVVAALESPDIMAKTLGPTGRFARALAHWRRLMAAGEPPPVDYVEVQLRELYGRVVDEDTTAAFVKRLARALPADPADLEQLSAFVAQHGGSLVTPELCRTVASAAVKLVGTQTPTPDVTATS